MAPPAAVPGAAGVIEIEFAGGGRMRITGTVEASTVAALMKALKRGYRVGEVASHEYERRWGTSKVVVWKLWFAYVWSFLRNLI